MKAKCLVLRGRGRGGLVRARAQSSASTSATSTSKTPAQRLSTQRLVLTGGVGIGLGLGLGLGLGQLQLQQGQLGLLGEAKVDDDDERGGEEKNTFGASVLPPIPFLLGWIEKLKPRRVTDALLLTNCVTFTLQKMSRGWVSAWLCKHNACIAKGQIWRLMTPALLHGNLLHLLVNCYTLNHLGPGTEALFGPKRMLAVYVLSGVSGNVFSFYMNSLPAVGSSGALFGLLGALGYFYHKHSNVLKKEHVERPLRSLHNMLITNMVIGLATPNIDNWAHMGGLFAGIAAVLLLGPNFKIEKSDPPVLVDKPVLPVLASKPLSLAN